MKEELLKKLHTAMCNDNEHQCNRLNNYIHTDEYLTAEVVKVVEEIVTEATKELKEQIKVKDIQIKELVEQRQYWKDSSFDWRHKFFKKRSVKRLIAKDKQLTEAKEIMKKYLSIGVGGKITQNYLDVTKEAEQFLSEVEK